MESVVDAIPISLRGELSKRLIDIVLGAERRDSIPTELAKKIIYLWRQDQLASRAGIQALLEAALMVDAEATFQVCESLGLKEVAVTLRNL